MNKFIRISFVFILIFACGCFGVKLYDSSKQPDFCNDVVTFVPPNNYDLRDYIDIGVEHQYNYGICYAFASLTSLETYLALNYGEYYDFSELHFATSMCLQDNYYSSINDALHQGGNFAHFTLYTQKDKSLVLEQLMPMSTYRMLSGYTLSSRLTNDFNTINNSFYSLVKVNDTKSYPQFVGNKANYSSSELAKFRNDIKYHIMNYGALTAGIYSGSSFNNNTINYCITNDALVTDQNTINDNINHLISIVGWDDNYDANGAWTNKGAYLCLNSWGTDFGQDGYFYVSYDDYFIESTIQGVANATLSTTNAKISTISSHQYKTTMFTHSYSESFPTTFSANIINTAHNVGQKITYIDSFIKGGSTKFYVKFFNTKAEALAGINGVTTQISAIKVDDYTLSTKYRLTTPLSITGNYMVLVREVRETQKYHSLGANTADNVGFEPCYSYQGSVLGKFDLTKDVWDPIVSDRQLDFSMPIILHTDKTYVEVSPFSSDVDAVINNKYIRNNATFTNKVLELTLKNANLTTTNLNNIKITKLLSNTNVARNFQFTFNNNILSIKMINDLTGNFAGEYLVTIPCGNTTIYRLIEIQDVATFSITYHLNGGTASNPEIYTNKQTSLTLNNPTKPGYKFVGWYTNNALTIEFNPNNLPYTNLVLYAKYDFATPTIVAKSNDVSITYYKGINIEIGVTASHDLTNAYNTLSYQWFIKKDGEDTFKLIENSATPCLTLNTVAQSGYYACVVTITITDPNLTSTSITKSMPINSNNTILVNIKPYIYDMSNVKWNYTEPFSYDTNTHSVQLINLPNGVTASYTGNSNSQINTYVAHANLIYDNMEGNAIAHYLGDLTWEIRKSRITININSIYSHNALTTEQLNSTYSCEITNEYLPSNIVSIQDKINYLNLKYHLTDTDNSYIKTITATTNSFEIHDIIINGGEYRIIINTLTSNNITASNSKGFVSNCTFNASSHQITNSTQELLNNQNLTLINAYNLNFSYLKNDIASISLPIDRQLLLNGLSVYMLKDGKLTKLEYVTTKNGITFNTSDASGTYLLVKQDLSKNTNKDIIVLISIICLYLGLFTYALISKHKNTF